jgi:hypothetical protein
MAYSRIESIVDIKFRFGTAVISCNEYYYNNISRIVKSSNGISWQNITTDTNGKFFDVALNDFPDCFVTYLPLSGGVYGTDYLKKITGLSTVSNVTSSGSRSWQCVDIDNFSGANKYILVGTDNGLYRSNDGGATFTAL